MNTKEEWIAETMKSLDGIQRAKSTPVLHEQLNRILTASDGRIVLLQSRLLLKIAAGLALLIALNIISLSYYSRSTRTETANPLVSEYFSYIKTIIPEP